MLDWNVTQKKSTKLLPQPENITKDKFMVNVLLELNDVHGHCEYYILFTASHNLTRIIRNIIHIYLVCERMWASVVAAVSLLIPEPSFQTEEAEINVLNKSTCMSGDCYRQTLKLIPPSTRSTRKCPRTASIWNKTVITFLPMAWRRSLHCLIDGLSTWFSA